MSYYILKCQDVPANLSTIQHGYTQNDEDKSYQVVLRSKHKGRINLQDLIVFLTFK